MPRSVLSLNQDIVPLSQEEKCGLKYVIHTPNLHSLKGSFWAPKIAIKANIRANSFAFSVHIKHLVWSDHRPL
jgi:hypothetical protein